VLCELLATNNFIHVSQLKTNILFIYFVAKSMCEIIAYKLTTCLVELSFAFRSYICTNYTKISYVIKPATPPDR